jgi:hypothetical protein
MMAMRGVQPEEIPVAWPGVVNHITQALKYSYELELEEVRRKLLTGEMQLWLVTDEGRLKATLVTEITPPIFNLLLVGGEDVDEWIDHLVEVCEWFGAQHGCKYLEVVGREGWRKIGRRLGFEHLYTIYRKEIDHG